MSPIQALLLALSSFLPPETIDALYKDLLNILFDHDHSPLQ